MHLLCCVCFFLSFPKRAHVVVDAVVVVGRADCVTCVFGICIRFLCVLYMRAA